MRAYVSLSLRGCGKRADRATAHHQEACFRHILSHASPGEGHFPGDSSSPVEEPTGSAFPGRRTRASVVASAVGAVAGEMADVAQVTSLPDKQRARTAME